MNIRKRKKAQRKELNSDKLWRHYRAMRLEINSCVRYGRNAHYFKSQLDKTSILLSRC